MMSRRRIRITAPDWSLVEGVEYVVPVKVSWPELQLTREQVEENAIREASNVYPRYVDYSIFEIAIQRPGVQEP